MPPPPAPLPSPNVVYRGPWGGTLIILPSGGVPGSLWRFEVFGPHAGAPFSLQLCAKQIVHSFARDSVALMAVRRLYTNQWGGLVGLSADEMVARLELDLADGIMFKAFYAPGWDFTGFVTTKPVDISGLLADPPGTPLDWSPAQRIAAMLRRIPGCMPVALRDTAAALLTPKAIALFATLAVGLAASQAFGGEIIDTILVAAAWAYAGWQGLIALKDFIAAIIDAAGETSLAPIEEDAQTAAHALTILGLTFLAAILHRSADQEKVTSLESDPPKDVPPVKKPPPVVKGWKDFPSTAKPTNTVPPSTGSNVGTTASTKMLTGDGQSFAGHGGIVPNPDGTLPTTTVPQGTSVTVFTGPDQGLFDDAGQRIEAGDTSGGMNLQNSLDPQSTTGAMTYLPGSQIPNYMLYPGPDLNLLPGSMTVETPTPLSELLQPNMGRVNWAACTTVIGK